MKTQLITLDSNGTIVVPVIELEVSIIDVISPESNLY